ncbi:hypothetical protein DM02DRAFT_618270 [Periconia macrospinosa]|uniref:ATPase synthesis protein 25 n=1 Tax=Periconia macrospinosa TaxID=97972 RepID=A0A2V1DBL8_9PLEO|nr:hypothetical protein DM02DRAFT_618270 [Periconia macrospinosa]
MTGVRYLIFTCSALPCPCGATYVGASTRRPKVWIERDVARRQFICSEHSFHPSCGVKHLQPHHQLLPMSIPRALASGLGCCRTCSTGAISRSSSTPTLFRRSIASSVRRRTQANDPLTASESNFAFSNDFNDTSNATSSATSSTSFVEPDSEAAPSSSSPLPWYLQNRPAPTPQQAVLIPDLPPNPPPLLETILDYVANTAGMDDLQLLDLRHLDPPPALGPKLIMLLCTARSEKHLHVSADRMCRWLRREHSLRANAAGLLGRNELKIKLRRKAKRMKMMANVGATEPEGNIDDGIRTGWICCTIGKIEAHPLDTEMPGANVDNFVGFRDVKPGVNVVIQMFTEEKRDEIDLETLWGGVVKTGHRKDRVADEMLREVEEVIEEAEAESESPPHQPRDLDEYEQKLYGKTPTPPTQHPAHQPTNPTSPPTPTTPQFKKTRPSTGDAFPDVASFQKRRIHSVGLRA